MLIAHAVLEVFLRICAIQMYIYLLAYLPDQRGWCSSKLLNNVKFLTMNIICFLCFHFTYTEPKLYNSQLKSLGTNCNPLGSWYHNS